MLNVGFIITSANKIDPYYLDNVYNFVEKLLAHKLDFKTINYFGLNALKQHNCDIIIVGSIEDLTDMTHVRFSWEYTLSREVSDFIHNSDVTLATLYSSYGLFDDIDKTRNGLYNCKHINDNIVGVASSTNAVITKIKAKQENSNKSSVYDFDPIEGVTTESGVVMEFTTLHINNSSIKNNIVNPVIVLL